MISFAIVIAGLALAYANGANDNFKGVATLFGSGSANYRRALWWATGTTLLGSLLAGLFAQTLVHRFTGKGLVSDALTLNPNFTAALGLAAGITVLAATRFGFPISTTHAMVGGLIGVAIASSAAVRWVNLANLFLAPLLFSPVLSLLATVLLYRAFRWCRLRLGVSRETCLCAGTEMPVLIPITTNGLALDMSPTPSVTIGTTVTCQERYEGRFLGLDAASTLDGLHYLSAGLVCLARGLNDTPKIAALLMMVPFLGVSASMFLCALVIAVGGLTNGRRVAETMSRRITSMNPGQGFTANFVTGVLVIVASACSLPVSTTHVSCGSLFGLGACTGTARWGLIGKIFLYALPRTPEKRSTDVGPGLISGSDAWE